MIILLLLDRFCRAVVPQTYVSHFLGSNKAPCFFRKARLFDVYDKLSYYANRKLRISLLKEF